jgi:tagaturonate epimerase
VDRFIAPCDFFTLDVADSIGQPADAAAINQFCGRHNEIVAGVEIPGIPQTVKLEPARIHAIAAKYLKSVQDAGTLYRRIAQAKAGMPFVVEVSMDETDSPQTPSELLVILAALADEKIPLQTIAPKFTGRFNKGVDYVGDVAQFEREFNDDLCVIAFAVGRYGLLADLKLSVHSGSDKFSIYPAIRRALARHHAGVHVKTAGTTWLEECIGLAEAGGEGLKLVQEIYGSALEHIEELSVPYATVIDIDRNKLPTAAEARGWTSDQFVRALRHQQNDPLFNPNLRQLLHVGFKVAAKMGRRYLDEITACEQPIARNVTTNLFDRHIRPLFIQAA